MFSFFLCIQVKGAAVVSDLTVEWIRLQILKKSKQFVNRTWCIFMAERVGDIFPVTCLQLEFQAYRLITVVRYSGFTAGQNTLKLPCAYCIEIWRTRESMIIQGAAERTPLFEKRINSKPKKIWQMFFYFWKAHRTPFYINVFWTNHHSSGGLEYWYTDVASR